MTGRGDPDADQNHWVHSFDASPLGLQSVTFFSDTIERDCGYSLYLPPSYERHIERRFPALYWLHGRRGNPSAVEPFVERLAAAIREGRAPEMIVVGVNGLRQSMYCDSRDGAFPVETIVVKGLIPHVDATYRTRLTREMRGIEGFSMGGFGAAHLGFKYPDLFGVVSILGVAMHDAAFLRDRRQSIFAKVFGSELDYCQDNVPWTLVEQNVEQIRGHTAVRVHVGEGDPLVEKNVRFHQLLERLQVAHEFSVVPKAGHNVREVYDNFVGHPFAFYQKVWPDEESG
jgi:endo-1,4-beta-xylanase